ncbi:MAG: hypothetical protein KGZ84_06360 [Erysipelotrichia bacterium]|jgi:hypothetical protein|nr:hypothetical protein [Erysipelotrichia bacterium]
MNTLIELFTNHDIFYAVGGSWMLKHMGLEITPHDIDIFMHENDIQKAVNLCLEVALLQPPIASGPFLTPYFYRFHMKDTRVDLMANFGFAHEEGHYHAIFDELSIVKHIEKDGLSIPLMSLEEWFVMYEMMKREKQVKLIETYWSKYGIEFPHLLKRQLQLNIPIHVKTKIEELMK